MAVFINSNLMARNATNSLGIHYGYLQASTQKLSSGLRTNSSSHDTSSVKLAIRELLRVDVAALNRSFRSANDIISLIQIADGALDSIDGKLVRMKKLAVQASINIYNSLQRLVMDSEYQLLASEITRIANVTEFNGVKLLDGTLSGVHGDLVSLGVEFIYFGDENALSEDYCHITIGNSSASALGLGSENGVKAGYTLSTLSQAQVSLTAVNEAIVSKDKIRAHLGAMQNRLEAVVGNLTARSEHFATIESLASNADVAIETTEFVFNQVLSKSLMAIVGQANVTPRMALNLIIE